MTRHALLVGTLLVGLSGAAYGQGGKGYPVVPLSVTIDAIDNVVVGETGITGDGAAYVNGAPDGTTANIDKYGNLIISFGRAVTFSYGEEPGAVGPVTGAYDSYISTLRAGGVPLQNLVAGTSQCIKLNWQYDIPGGWMRHGFNRGIDGTVEDDTSYAVVTREDADTWVVEPKPGSCGTYNNPDIVVASVFSQVSQRRKGWVFTDYGRYTLPFKLTLTRTP